jgi:hypothetical protein
MAEALADAGLESSSLIVEVTESVLASESGHIIDTIETLRDLGVRVAIDDFGTGYSSFAALADLEIDIVKIDRRFVDNLQDDQGRALFPFGQTLPVLLIGRSDWSRLRPWQLLRPSVGLGGGQHRRRKLLQVEARDPRPDVTAVIRYFGFSPRSGQNKGTERSSLEIRFRHQHGN